MRLTYLLASIVIVVVTHASSASAEALTHHEQAAWLGGQTKTEQLAWMRQEVRSGRYGERGLTNFFKGFNDQNFIDPTIPGVTKNIRALGSQSPWQAKGAARTLLYATVAYQDPRFRLVAVDQPVNASYGRTDKDLVLKHRVTGQAARIEVKDVQPVSQRSDLDRIKRQIDKMAAESRMTGELQVWANRQRAIPEIKLYARQRGVPVYDGMKQSQFNTVLDDLDRRSLSATRHSSARWLGRGGLVGMLAYESYAIHGLLTGRMSERAFVINSSSLAGGAIGAWATAQAGMLMGMKVGALLGFGVWDAVTVPIGTAVGGFAGIVLGGLFGSEIAGQVAVSFYERMDEAELRRVDALVYQHYGL